MIGYDRAQWFASLFREDFITKYYGAGETGYDVADIMIGYDRAQWFASQFREDFITRYYGAGETGYDVVEMACCNICRRIFAPAPNGSEDVSPARCTAHSLCLVA